MPKRPLTLVLAALVFLYFPAEVFDNYWHHHHVSALDLLLSVALPLAAMVGILHVSRIGWYTLFAGIALWGINDLYHYYQASGAGATTLFAHLLIYLSSVAYFINPRIRHLYFDPKLRWWRTKPRYETHLPMMMQHHQQWHYPVLRNISDGGCFIETPHPAEMGSTVGVVIPLPVPLEVSVIQAEGQVRWISNNPLRHGMGVQFTFSSKKHAKAVKQFVALQL